MRRTTTLSMSLMLSWMVQTGCGPRPVNSGVKAASPQAALTVPVAQIRTGQLHVKIQLPGDLRAWEQVAVYPRVEGFVTRVDVDRGSRVHVGQKMAKLTAPDLVARRARARSLRASARARWSEARARMEADAATFQRLQQASRTPGVVAGNDLIVEQQRVRADQAQVESLRQEMRAAAEHLSSLRALEDYLVVRAPFSGLVTQRDVNPGALAGPQGIGNAQAAGPDVPMFRMEQIARLRLVVWVPEADSGAVQPGARVPFTVPAYPGRRFVGTIARLAHELDDQTRTMPVELDVANPDEILSPGMYAQVTWPVQRRGPSLFASETAVVRNTQGTFLMVVRAGHAVRVPVETGESDGGRIEVFGAIQAGEMVIRNGADQVPDGAAVQSHRR